MRGNHDYIETDADQLDRLSPRHRPRLGQTTTVPTALLALVVLAAGCGGGAKTPGGAAAGSSGVAAKFEAFAKCMRSHGISDFPDPTSGPDGGVGIILNGGRGSDLDPNNPRFKAAQQGCQSLAPAAHPTRAQSATKIAAEVKWAHCMRSHGIPSFPDPNGQGAFDSSKFNENTPAFQSASKACQSLINAAGAVPVVPGRGSG
jgi:hypothetical protein